MALAGLLLQTQPFTGRIEDIYRHLDSVRVPLASKAGRKVLQDGKKTDKEAAGVC